MAFFGSKDISNLSSVDMTLYRYITLNSDQIIYMRVRDIANNAHVSNSSVMRFVHKMGFSSFPEFKSYIRDQKTESDFLETFNFVNQDNFPPDIRNRIQLVTDIIFESDNIISVGMGSSAPLANYLSRQLAALGYNTTSVIDPFYPLHTSLENTTNNVLIVFSMSGETLELIELLNDFQNSDDTTVISICGNETSTIARMGSYSLTYTIDEIRIHHYYDLSSQIPPMYISEGLLRNLFNKSKKE